METLHDAFAAARETAPQAAFLAESALSGGREWTFEEAGREVDRLAGLYGRAGWGAGHRIALGVGNHPRHFFHLLALNRLGAYGIERSAVQRRKAWVALRMARGLLMAGDPRGARCMLRAAMAHPDFRSSSKLLGYRLRIGLAAMTARLRRRED